MASKFDPLVRRRLHAHPHTPCVPVDEVAVEIGIEDPNVLVVHYRIVGDIHALRVPSPSTKLDPDRLWEHTCCEMFVAPIAADEYVEWNFSPTGQFAYFEFSSYRKRRPSSTGAAARLSVAVDHGKLRLEARAPLPSGLGELARISITTVIEDAEGGLSYWALRHPCDRPDFHDPGGFGLALTLTPSPAIVDVPPESP